ncbi:DNA topoisomerase I, bacterial [Rubidibacter lacunae KORDI 51-2]|uniref:DNA topoisomerase 1 n=1 Tax=Rubidibacter lacunae KORDI 51-2 TaxID=582515 RepID=U5D6E6_9CHRO|nr:type I DNA topoisomerase [Rubidibacter lacunae]ERN40218.1 DNA topoisomerase I, bacterial [Rubidibacter lacunae KORDI 51-2]
MSKLVIVESPTKARTIRQYLPTGYRVEASMGHVRDLPASADEVPAKVKGEDWATLGVNVAASFEPLYVIPKKKQKVVKELKAALADADELVLATDEDREGESISWHLKELLKPKVPIKRMVFHEITREAIRKALNNCRTLNEDLVHAQETRRILDRLVGYTLSPLLWKKIAPGLSAGRVQSVAVRLLVQRERERQAFKSGTYWDLKALLAKDKSDFEAKLVSLSGRRLATGSDFDASTGQLSAGRNVVLLNAEDAAALKDRLDGKPWSVSAVDERPTTRKPSPPFTTSTLQQEANRKLRISARDTMRVAQSLYEQGFITYMRTDSVHLSDQAVTAARSCVEHKYGKNYLSPKPRQYKTKSKGAQEAHEAIRPAGETFRTPQDTGLSGRELSLYDLIWKRTVACQMADARLTQTSVRLQVEDAEFRASGKRIDFPGFFRAYVEGSDDPEAALEDREAILPHLGVGDRPDCRTLEALSHDTQPPARFTEASLVKTLESEGIGRPSTYATIMGTIVDRGYVLMRNSTLIPTFTAFAVTGLLEEHFPDLVDPGFTARMEQTLDDIATGGVQSVPYLETFYSGDRGLENQVKERETNIDPATAKAISMATLEDAIVRIGRYGPYVEVKADGAEPVTASLPEDLTPADLDPDRIQTLVRQKLEGPDKVGLHPETGEPIYLLVGRYGPYVQLGDKTETNKQPKRASLPKGTPPEELTLEQAVGLLKLPRLLGTHPETNRPVKAGVGPYGPYIVHERGKNEQGKVVKDYRSLKKEDDVLSVGLERALELLAQPKAGRGRGTKPPLRALGNHPEDGEPVNLFDGKYGPYVSHGKVNASLPDGATPDNITLEQAIAAIAAKGPTKSRSKSSKSGKSTATKSRTVSKSASASSSKTTKSTAKAKSSKSKSSESKSSADKSSSSTSTSTNGQSADSTASKKTTGKTTGRSKKVT